MLFLAGNTINAPCSAAPLAQIEFWKALDEIPLRCRRPKIRDPKSAMEEVMGIRTRKKPCFRKWENQGKNASLHVLVVVLLYILVGYSEFQGSACVTSGGESAVYLQIGQKKIVTVSHSVNTAKLGAFWLFRKWVQMKTLGESSTMTRRRKMLGYCVKLEASEVNRAAATQNCLENTTAHIWEYRTNVNGTVSSRMVSLWEFWNNQKFLRYNTLLWLLYVLQYITRCVYFTDLTEGISLPPLSSALQIR